MSTDSGNGDDKTKQAELYFGGVPTDGELKMLRDRWPDTGLQPGQTITCEEIAAVIHVAVKTARFRTVTERWRRCVERGPVGLVVGRHEWAFHILKAGQVVNSNESDLRSAAKKARRAAVRGAKIDVLQLSEDERKRHDLHVAMTGKVLSAMNVRGKQKALPAMA